MKLTPQQLMEKWSGVINHADQPEIKDNYRKQVTAILLENQEQAMREEKIQLNEAAPTNATGNVDKYDPVLIGLVRRAMPQLIAYDLCGVQPMNLPTGLVFALKSRYGSDMTTGAEALYQEANSAFSGAYTTNPGDGTQVGSSPVDGTNGLSPWDSTPGFTKGAPMTADVGEGLVPAQMGFTIEKHTVTAKSRALKAEYSIELAQDLKAVHGLDAESELSNILSKEITAEINREVIRTIYTIAQPGADYGVTTPGTFDLDTDANGRWSVERFKGMLFQIERDANRIAQITRRGRGNMILCSADVASALAMAGMLDYAPAISANLSVDDASTTFAGVLNGKYKVYVDPYMANGSVQQYYLVGYKGSSPYDAGMFYCPYVPLQMLRAVDPNTFQPKIGFKTRYGMIGNPLAGADSDSAGNVGMAAGKNGYYRLTKVANLT
jgi:hypothetical protein